MQFLMMGRSSICEGEEIKEQKAREGLQGPALWVLTSPTVVKEAERVTERRALSLEEMRGVAAGSVGGCPYLWSEGTNFNSGGLRSTSLVGDLDDYSLWVRKLTGDRSE